MTRWSYDDLPPRLRAQVDAALERRPQRPRTSQHAAPVRGGRWRCVACGNVERTLTATERHADQERHRRFEVILESES